MNKNKISHSFINKGKILFQNFRRLFTKKNVLHLTYQLIIKRLNV